MNLETTRLRGRPKNRWQDEVREDGRNVGGEGWQEKVHNREECKTLLRKAKNRCILHTPMERMNELFQCFSSHTKICISSHAPNRKQPITVRFTAHSSIVSPGCRTCCMSQFWKLKSGGDSWVFAKFVNPCINFSLVPYNGHWKIPNLTC